MKVVKHGNTVKEITCDNCGCIFKYCENDIKTKRFLAAPFTDYELDYTWSDIVECPECKSCIILNDLQTDFLNSISDEKKQESKDKRKFLYKKLRDYKRKENVK